MNLRIKELIKAQGLTMQEVADRLEITRDTLTRNINGNPTIETLSKIAKALNVEITDLFEKPITDEIVGFIKVGDVIHEIRSLNDLKRLASNME